MRIIILLTLLIFHSQSFADVDQLAVADFKSYLSTLKSVSIDFHQEDTRGTNADGTLVIVKPYKFICNYYAPYPLIILGNKSYIYIYDFSLEQLSRINAKDNMFSFLLTGNIDIENNFHINEAYKTKDELIVELFSSEMERITRVTVALKPSPNLKSIVTKESDDNIITMIAESVKQIKGADDSLFSIRNPDVYGKPKRMNREMLQKKFTTL